MIKLHDKVYEHRGVPQSKTCGKADGFDGKLCSFTERLDSSQIIVDRSHSINYQLAPGEVLLQCPYDSSHYVRDSRMNPHLLRCRKNRAVNRISLGLPAEELIRCRFETTHLLVPMEVQFHEDRCPYRDSSICSPSTLLQADVQQMNPSSAAAADETVGMQNYLEHEPQDKSQVRSTSGETVMKIEDREHKKPIHTVLLTHFSKNPDETNNNLTTSKQLAKPPHIELIHLENIASLTKRSASTVQTGKVQSKELKNRSQSRNIKSDSDTLPEVSSVALEPTIESTPSATTTTSHLSVDKDFEAMLSECLQKFSQLSLK